MRSGGHRRASALICIAVIACGALMVTVGTMLRTWRAERSASVQSLAYALLEHHPYLSPHRTPQERSPNTIFVSISSYRDEECAPTVLDMFRRAKDPRALFVGAVEQHAVGDPSCIPDEYRRCQGSFGFCPTDNIRRRIIEPRKARGPTFGRYVGMYMYQGETYLFMIDSHNRFATHWDATLLAMYHELPGKAVLSHYPEAWNHPKDGGVNAPLDNRQTTTYLCRAKLLPQGIPRLDGVVHSIKRRCPPQPWAAAGFLFANASLLREVPFDPHLHYIFDGEEILYSMRMWTHGWDIYSPRQSVIYHYYYRKTAKKFWGNIDARASFRQAAAVRRIQYLIHATPEGSLTPIVGPNVTEKDVVVDLPKYGMGTVRTVDDWWTYSGFNRVTRKLEKDWCSAYANY